MIVEVEEPGQVELQGLGLSGAADALTPARFDVLASDPARHDVRFSPASGAESRTLGVLAIDAPGSRRLQRDPSSRGAQPEGPTTAARIAARGADRPVHNSRLRAP